MADEVTASVPTGVPPGCAVVESLGRDDAGQIAALNVFPNGAPDLALDAVWEARPVRLAVESQQP